ncbi:MAG: hypothetical protein ABIS92_06330 [Polyangia bacterium]
MTNTLRSPLFDLAHLRQDDVAALRRDLPAATAPAPRRLTPWALGVLVVSVAGFAVVRRLIRT